MNTNRQRIAGLFAAAGATAALALAAAPAAFADGSWGAIAISPDGTRWAVSTGQADMNAARTTAAYRCMGNGPGCSGNVTAFTDCGVLVRDGGNLFIATGATKEDAEDVAEEQHPGSTQVTWGCNDPKGSGPASYRG